MTAFRSGDAGCLGGRWGPIPQPSWSAQGRCNRRHIMADPTGRASPAVAGLILSSEADDSGVVPSSPVLMVELDLLDPQEAERPDIRGVVVVGADGSRASWTALEVAAREAILGDWSLRIVTCWAISGLAYSDGMRPPPDYECSLEARASQVAFEASAYIRNRYGGLRTEVCVKQGLPQFELVAAARDAELIVVGSSRWWWFLHRLVAGSVVRYLNRHAPCPVRVVRTTGSARCSLG